MVVGMINAIDKYSSQLAVANQLGAGELIEIRRRFAAPHRGVRLASAEAALQCLGEIRHFAGMEFLASIHEEIEAAKPSVLKDNDPNDDKWDNSPYYPNGIQGISSSSEFSVSEVEAEDSISL